MNEPAPVAAPEPVTETWTYGGIRAGTADGHPAAALRLVGNHRDAEDIAQEALVAAWQQLPGFRAESGFTT